MLRLCFAGIACFASAFGAQADRVTLAPANGRLTHEFSELTRVRELRDGRVLLYDTKEERLLAGDFPSGSVYDVARKGQGPEEFEFIGALLPLGGDTTIAADQTRRWLILVGDSVVQKLLPEHPTLQRLQLAPLGADGNYVLTRLFGGGWTAIPDSTPIALVHRGTGKLDTIARMANSGRRGPIREARGAAQIRRLPLEWAETAILFSDGWIAVVRIDPYRVDWRAPNGTWTLGRQLPVRAVRVTGAEKAAYIARQSGFRNATDWPEEFPAFETPATILASPDGRLLVKRLPTLAEPGTRYDVIDRAGSRRAQLVLAATEHVLGFGAGSIYVVTTDDNGIQHLRRHPWPTSQRP
jgi:hypothetical protein